jgi:hypothetical protein
VLQAVNQILPDREWEEVGILADIADPPAGHGLGQIFQLPVANRDRARGRVDQVGKQHAEMLFAARAVADDCQVIGQAHLEADRFDEPGVGFVEQGDRRANQIALERRSRICLRILRRRIEQVGRLKLLDNLVVLDLHVQALLVPVDQLLDRTGQVLVGEDHGHQGTDIQTAADRQQTPHGIEDKGRQLSQEVVQELHEELALEDLEADPEDSSQPPRDLGPLEVRGVVGVDLDRTVDQFPYASGQLPRGQLPLAAQLQDPPAQLGDEKGLDQNDERGDQAEPKALHDNEEHGGQRLAGEEGRRHEGISNEAAERLHLVLDHGRHFRLLDPAGIGNRKAQDTVGQLVAQPAQHALAQAALKGIDDELEGTVDQHEAQEGETEHDQEAWLLELEALEEGDRGSRQGLAIGQVESEERLGRAFTLEALALNALVDDLLGQVE